MRLSSLILIFVSILSAIEMNFRDLEIKDFIKMVAKITHKNILITAPIKGKVDFVSVKPIKKEELYPLLVSILKSKGYTIKKDKGFLKVIRLIEAVKEAPPLGKSDVYQFQTTILALENIPAQEAFRQVSYLVSRFGKIVVNKEKNLLIITDFPQNLEVIKKIIKKIDKENNILYENIEIKNTQASKIYPQLLQMINTLYNPKVYKYKLILNDATNSIMIAASKGVIASAKEIILNLDKKPINQNTAVIRLKNSDVSNIQKILEKIIRAKYIKNRPSITADKETNSLIILATSSQLHTLKEIIKKLDIPKQQVYVKARILEISNLKAASIGQEYGLIGGLVDSSGLYTISANLGGVPLAFDPQTLGLSIPNIKKGLALGATLDLLEITGAAKKLSEPSILCINNTPSTIYVGKTVSVITGKTTSTQTTQSYTREDIGLTLKITPRIDSDNKVALNVDTVVEDILPGSAVGLPTTSKRKINTTTIVNNGQSVIIGGLVKDNKNITLQKVPLLGDIPLIGALFRHKNIDDDKTTLVIVLTPYIVKEAKDLDKLRETLAKLDTLEKKFVKKILKKKKQKENRGLEYENIREY